jgi:hypothetical protein
MCSLFENVGGNPEATSADFEDALQGYWTVAGREFVAGK